MAEIQDSEFLRILQESPVVTPDQVRSAQERQRDELDRQGSCRSLFAILCEQGLIDERVARTLRLPSREGLPGDVTPHTPTVVLHPPEPAPSDKPPSSSSSISSVRSARKRPPEVDQAAAEARNLIGPYILVREVGKGGMGRVYRAWDQNVGRFVAVKVMDTEDVSDRERFVREAQIAGRLHHPSIATVFQAGEQETRGYIAMQFIEGGPIDAQKLPLLTALALIRDAARALSYAHEQGVVHRDVKPGNLMVDGKGQVFLTDFGLAKEVVANAGTALSITGTTFGTPQFMSPEQARGEHKKIDGRSDVYSLGATLYALLARRPPFTSTNLATLLLEVLDKQPPPLSRFNREISPELQMIVERSMAKDPGRRFPTMAAFAEALDKLIREGRYAGRYGMAKALARRWFPRLAIAGALAAAAWFAAPVLLRPAAPSSAAPAAPEDPAPGMLRAATGQLRIVEEQPRDPGAVDRQVMGRIDDYLKLRPGDLRGRALRVRALYVKGDREAVAKELRELDAAKGDDYRLLLVSALLALEAALEVRCPLPAPEAPAFEWEEPPAPWPAAFASVVDALARAPVAPDLEEEYGKDKDVRLGLSSIAAGRCDDAVERLRRKPLPVFPAAWCRSAYLARRFEDVLAAAESEGRRERLGAALATGKGIEPLLGSAGADAPALHAALARVEGASGVAAHVEAGLAGAGPERQAALISALQRSRAPSGADDEKEYRRGIALAGESPSTWQGRLAAVELRLGLGSRLLRSRGAGRPLLEEAVARADALAAASSSWAEPVLLSAQARLRLGRIDEARSDLAKLPGPARKGARAVLTASAAELAAAERERRSGGAGAAAFAKAALQELLSAPREHAEALAISGAASLILAQQAAEEGKDESGFVAEAAGALSKALERLPGFVEARYRRAWARFFQAEIARRGGGDGREADAGAKEDADAVLGACPEFSGARYLRGIVNFNLGRDPEAMADWRALIASDPSWDTADVRSWIQRAEDRQKKQ